MALTLQGFLEKNLTGILLGGVALYGGYITGQTTTRGQIEQLQKTTNELRDESRKWRPVMSCLFRHIDHIESGARGERPCSLAVPE